MRLKFDSNTEPESETRTYGYLESVWTCIAGVVGRTVQVTFSRRTHGQSIQLGLTGKTGLETDLEQLRKQLHYLYNLHKAT